MTHVVLMTHDFHRGWHQVQTMTASICRYVYKQCYPWQTKKVCFLRLFMLTRGKCLNFKLAWFEQRFRSCLTHKTIARFNCTEERGSHAMLSSETKKINWGRKANGRCELKQWKQICSKYFVTLSLKINLIHSCIFVPAFLQWRVAAMGLQT